MPVGRPKKEKGPSRDDLSILQLVDAIKSIETQMLGKFAEVQSKLDDLGGKVPTKIAEAKGLENPKAPQPPEPSVPIPMEWRQVVDEVLSPKFGVAVRYLDTASFELTLDVPKEYSNTTSREWEANGYDHRVKIMPNYLGLQGVKDYCELVAKNLGPDILHKLQQDKVSLAQ